MRIVGKHDRVGKGKLKGEMMKLYYDLKNKNNVRCSEKAN